MTPTSHRDDERDLRLFIVQLGAALNEVGEPVDSVQQRLTAVARVNGVRDVRVSAFPTQLMVSMGRGEPAVLEITSAEGPARLDAIATLESTAREAERGTLTPTAGLARLETIRSAPPRYGRFVTLVGYAVLTVGVCLILHPTGREVAAAAVFGTIVGILRLVAGNQPTLRILTPVLAAFLVAALSTLAEAHGYTGAGLHAMVASLVVFLPGATLTTAVLELAAGQMVAGASRLVAGSMQLAMLAFGILAGIQSVGMPAQVAPSPGVPLDAWAPWVGVLVFGVGVAVAYSAPRRSVLTLMLVLYAARAGQVVGNQALGAYVGAFVGAVVMMLVAFFVARLPSAMPARALFVPSFWLLVPGALSLIGLTEYVGKIGTAGPQDLLATVASIFAVALGVLVGTQLLAWATATGRIVGEVSDTFSVPRSWWARLRRPSASRASTPTSTTPRRRRSDRGEQQGPEHQ